MEGYIKNLDFRFFRNFGKRYLSVDYIRRGEHNKYVLGKIPDWLWNNQSETNVRKYINQ